jgi:hypothetical protein
MGVTDSSHPANLLPGTKVKSYSVANQTITLNNAAQATSTDTLQFSGENLGFTFVDSARNCFTRVNPTYSQKEYGAVSDGQTNDTPPLQNWMNANQPHIAVAGNSVIRSPLICGGMDTGGHSLTDGVSIQGSPTQSVGQSLGAVPTFVISAPNSTLNPFSGAAMLIMEPHEACAIHGVGLIAGGNGATVNFDALDVDGAHALVDGHSMLSGGYYDLNTNSAGVNLKVYDSALNGAVKDDAIIGAPNTKLIRNVFAAAGNNGLTTSSSDISIVDNNFTYNQG